MLPETGGETVPSQEGSIYNLHKQLSGGRLSMNSRFAALITRIRSQRSVSTLVVLLTLSLGILIGTVLSRTAVKGNSARSDAALLPMQSPQQLSNTFGQVTKQISPPMLNISTDSTAKPRLRAGL